MFGMSSPGQMNYAPKGDEMCRGQPFLFGYIVQPSKGMLERSYKLGLNRTEHEMIIACEELFLRARCVLPIFVLSIHTAFLWTSCEISECWVGR